MDENSNLVVSIAEFVKDRLYFLTLRSFEHPKTSSCAHYFSVENLLVYENFFSDFGPLNLAMLYRYCNTLNMKMRNMKNKRIVHTTSSSPEKRLNSAYLIASYAIIYLDFSPQQAFEALTTNNKDRFIEFRDASVAEPYTINLLDCLSGVYKAKTMGFFNFDSFDAAHYEYYERVENGDLNWIVPRKFIAFCGPHHCCRTVRGYPLHAPSFYHRYFRGHRVTTIVRLNKRSYDAALFTDAGFAHRDLYFVDGSTPTDDIVQQFLHVCETSTGAIAVHCKAGLGRTGTLIACYIMKHYRFTAREAIAWIRICRPGSIIGHQHDWLLGKQTEMWYAGQQYRRRLRRPPAPERHKVGIYERRSLPFAGVRSIHHRIHDSLHNNNNNADKGFGGGPDEKATVAVSSAGSGGSAYRVIQQRVNTLKLEDTAEGEDIDDEADDMIDIYDIAQSDDNDIDIDSHDDMKEGDDGEVPLESERKRSTYNCAGGARVHQAATTDAVVEQVEGLTPDEGDDSDVSNGNENDNGGIRAVAADVVAGIAATTSANNNNNNNNNNHGGSRVGMGGTKPTRVTATVIEMAVMRSLVTQGDKLNQIKAQRRHAYPMQSTSNSDRKPLRSRLLAQSDSGGGGEAANTSVTAIRKYGALSTYHSQHNTVVLKKTSATASDTSFISTTTKSGRSAAGYLNPSPVGGDNGTSSPGAAAALLRRNRRQSPRIAAAAAARAARAAAPAPSATGGEAGGGNSSTSSSNEEIIRPDTGTWLCRVVPAVHGGDKLREGAIDSNSTKMTKGAYQVCLDTRVKRALGSDRRNVKMPRKSTASGTTPTIAAGATATRKKCGSSVGVSPDLSIRK